MGLSTSLTNDRHGSFRGGRENAGSAAHVLSSGTF